VPALDRRSARYLDQDGIGRCHILAIIPAG
jgi:hypothetical protein